MSATLHSQALAEFTVLCLFCRPRSVELIRKPVLSVMGLLSLLGSQQVYATVLQSKQLQPLSPLAEVYASNTAPISYIHGVVFRKEVLLPVRIFSQCKGEIVK